MHFIALKNRHPTKLIQYKLVYKQNVFCYLDFCSYLKANYPKSLPFALKSAFAFEIHCKKHSTTLKTTAKRPSTLVTDLMGNRFQSIVA